MLPALYFSWEEEPVKGRRDAFDRDASAWLALNFDFFGANLFPSR
jgi:hypothetical protein